MKKFIYGIISIEIALLLPQHPVFMEVVRCLFCAVGGSLIGNGLGTYLRKKYDKK